MKKIFFYPLVCLLFLLCSITIIAQEADDYAFTTNTSSSFANMSNGDTLLGANLLLKSSAVIPLGFEMWFMGVRYTDFSVNTNGVIQMGKTQISNGANSYEIANTPRIVAFASGQQLGVGNWKTANDGSIRYITQGTSPNRIVIIEATNLLINNLITNATATFQIWLYETAPLPMTTKGGKIEFRYNKMQCGVDSVGFTRIGFGSTNANNKFKSVDFSVNPPTAKIANTTIENVIKKGNISNLNSIDGTNLRIFTFESPEPNGQAFNLKGTSPTNTEVVLNWEENASNEVGSVIYKSLNGKDFEFLTQVNGGTTYTDKDVKLCTNYYYRVYTVTEGKLGVLQPTGSLTYQITLPLPLDIKGTLYSCSTNPASVKEIEAIDEKNSFENFYWLNSQKDTLGRTNTFKPVAAGNYQLVGETKAGCTVTKNFTVTECCEIDFAIPTAFTPFSTPFNNTFLVKAENVTKFELKIFNRWGMEVFATTDATKGWDGTLNGSQLQAGAYQVVVTYSGCKEGKPLNETAMAVLYLIE